MVVYVGLDSEEFETFLRSIDLTEFDDRFKLSVIFEKSVQEIILKTAREIGDYERECGQIVPVIDPETFARLLRPGEAIRNWICLVLGSPALNLAKEENQLVSSSEDLLDPKDEYPYRKFVHILNLILVSAPGLCDFYSNTSPINRESLSPLTISYLTWNRFEIFIKSFKTVLSQSLPEGSTLQVIDNHSTDRTPEVMSKFDDKYDFVKYVRLEENRGVPGGMHAGYEHADGEVIIFLDNDVLISSQCDNWIESLLEPFTQHQRVGAVAAWGVTFTSDSDSDWITKTWLPGITLPVARYSGFCLAFRKEALDDIGGFRPDLFGKWGGADQVIPWLLREEGWIVTAPAEQPIANPIPYDEEMYDYERDEELKEGQSAKEKLGVESRRVLNLARGNQTLENND